MGKSIFGTRRTAWLVLVLGVFVSLIGISGKGPLINEAQEYSQEIATSSAATFVSLRSINAAISFVEEVQVTGSAVVASGSVNPFKFLEPIDDAVEQLSSSIIWVGAISGVLTVVLPVLGGAALVMIGLSLSAVAGLYLFKPRLPFEYLISNFLIAVAQLGGLGFLVVISFTISSWFADGISDKAWGKYEALLTEVAEALPTVSKEDISTLNEPEVKAPRQNEEVIDNTDRSENEGGRGILDQAGDLVKSTYEGASNAVTGAASSVSNFSGYVIDSVTDKTSSSYSKAKAITKVFVDKADDLVVALMAIFAAFLFKTAVFPILILFGLYKVFRGFKFTLSETRPNQE